MKSKVSKQSVTMLIIGFTLCGQVAAGVTFTQGPEVEGQRLKFAVSKPTDVEIAVLNAAGEIVRHWAAGVLGAENPPPEPLKQGLEQDLTWDGNDDQGNPAEGGPFSFRVRAGIKPEFDGFPLHHPHNSGRVLGVAAAPEGHIYVFHQHGTANSNQGSHDIKVYDHDGRYVRTLKPFAADIPQERVEATNAFQDDEGRLVPRIFNFQQLNFYPDPHSARLQSMPRHAIPAADSRGTVYWIAARGRRRTPLLISLDADGGVSRKDFLGPRILPDIDNLGLSQHYPRGTACLAVSSDDKYVYISGMSPSEGDDLIPCVFRVETETLGPGEIFIGNLDETGKEGALLTSPRGMATADGLLYVADRDADRVAVFREEDGSFVGQINVPRPDTIGVDPESGAVYVCSLSGDPPSLIKFDGYEKGNELYRTELPRARGRHRITVSAGARPIRIWMPALHYGAGFTCIEDKGDSFKTLGDPRPEGPRTIGPRDLSYDRDRDELYVKVSGEHWHRICGKTHSIVDTLFLGASHRMSDKATQMLAAPDGSLVTLSYRLGLMRWTRDAKPLNWDGLDTHGCPWGGIMTFTQNYLALHEDEIFFIPNAHYRGGERSRFTSLNVMGYDREERRTAIWQLSRGSIPRIDSKGNIYIATMVRDPKQPLPPFFDDKMPPLQERMRFSSAYWYSYMYGGIVKFTPEGGSIWFKEGEISDAVIGEMPEQLKNAPKKEFGFHYYLNPLETGQLQNAEWFRSGFSPYSETYPVGTPTCMCEGAGFDVDGWGRVFYPNLGQYRVEIIDNNNNWIGTFGHYGNEDSIGGGKAVETAYQHEGTEREHPDIPLAWPTYVAVSDTHAYVNDTLSNRVVAVRLNAELTETVEVPPTEE